MSEAPGPINFTMFLTMFGEKLNGTDPEDVIRNAFACFDEEASGTGSARAAPRGTPERESQAGVSPGGSCRSALPRCPLLMPALPSLQASSTRTTSVSC